MIKKIETNPQPTEADEKDFRKLVLNELIDYLTIGEGSDLLKKTVRGIIRDEIYGNENSGPYTGDSSTATRAEIRRLIKEELYSPGEAKADVR